MESLLKKSVITSRGFTYRYYTSPHIDPSRPALLLCHGFPETAHLWQPLLPFFATLPHRLLIPDLLGYGGSSKPTEPLAYANNDMVQDLVDICDAENIWRVVSIGHDHGSGIAARFYNHAPQRVAGLIMLNVGFPIPEKQQSFDLDAKNASATRTFGYPLLEYWHFLTSPEATRILNNNLERLWDCAHAGTFEEKKSLYCVPGAMKRYLFDHSIPRISIKSYAHERSLKQRWISQFQVGGFAGPLCWYTSRVINAQVISDKHIPDANDVVKVPTLFIGCDQDTVCRAELINGARDGGLLPDLTIKTMEGVAHWPMYEAPQETAMLIMEFLREKQL